MEELFTTENKYIDLAMQLDGNETDIWKEVISIEYELEKLGMSKKEIKKLDHSA